MNLVSQPAEGGPERLQNREQFLPQQQVISPQKDQGLAEQQGILGHIRETLQGVTNHSGQILPFPQIPVGIQVPEEEAETHRGLEGAVWTDSGTLDQK